MNKKIIEQYLDEIGITPGEWEVENTHNVICYDGSGLAYDIKKENAILIAASRKMLIGLIFSLTEHGKTNTHWPEWTGDIMIIIQSATGKPWDEIRARLEELEKI